MADSFAQVKPVAMTAQCKQYWYIRLIWHKDPIDLRSPISRLGSALNSSIITAGSYRLVQKIHSVANGISEDVVKSDL